jgi:hypothetical protein
MAEGAVLERRLDSAQKCALGDALGRSDPAEALTVAHVLLDL